MKNLFLYITFSLILWFIPVLFFSAIGAFIFDNTVRIAMRSIIMSPGIILVVLWCIAAFVMAYYQIWPEVETPGISPLYNDLDEVMNQKQIDNEKMSRAEMQAYYDGYGTVQHGGDH